MSAVTTSGTTDQIVTEIPDSLKLLVRMVLRGFYSIEDALIIDLLVRNPCMKEDDIAELLRFERKQLRARIATLRADKFIQMRLKMETGPDGKAQKVNYYFINYKTFVNVVKYKLDLIRKRMETEERDATSRASFKCNNCLKTFTDLEADQLFDMATQEFRCTFCLNVVEEDSSALPKKDSRLMLARFNEQMQPLYDLLRETEGIKLAPELLEPEPVDINTIRGLHKPSMPRYDGQQWSGEATRNQGFAVEDTRVDVSIMGDDVQEAVIERKDRPIWMTESTVFTDDTTENSLLADNALSNSQPTTSGSGPTNNRSRKENEDTMSLLLMYEPKTNQGDSIKRKNPNDSSSDSEDDDDIENAKIPDIDFNQKSESDDSDDDFPTVLVAGRPYPLNQINDSLIEQMTPQEKENYILVYQQQYSYIYEL